MNGFVVVGGGGDNAGVLFGVRTSPYATMYAKIITDLLRTFVS